MNFISRKAAASRPKSARRASLADLSEGQSAVLADLSRLPRSTSEHLMWLGFVPGVEITAGQSGPGGDPRVYRLCGSTFALRRETACCMSIDPSSRTPS